MKSYVALSSLLAYLNYIIGIVYLSSLVWPSNSKEHTFEMLAAMQLSDYVHVPIFM